VVECRSTLRHAPHRSRLQPQASDAVHHHAVAKPIFQVVCKKAAGGLLAGGLALVGPSSGTGQHMSGGMGGFPRGVVSEYNSMAPSRGSARQSSAPTSGYAGAATAPGFAGPVSGTSPVFTVNLGLTPNSSSNTGNSLESGTAAALGFGLNAQMMAASTDPSLPTLILPVSTLADPPITANVPEPPAALLLASCLTLLGAWRGLGRRSRARRNAGSPSTARWG
jgi:hypothetical protein